MNLIEQTKKYKGEQVIRRYLKNNVRNVKSTGIDSAKKIGVLFNATHDISFELVKKLVKELSSQNKEIMVLGYVHSKQLIDHYLYRKGFEFFTRTQLNWFYKPVSKGVDDFINKEFDILIYLSLEEYFPLKYVLSLSKAKFKVGRFTQDQVQLDLMIDIENEKKLMKDFKQELSKDANSKKEHLTNFDNIANQKAAVEIQMNFLINQLLHYLSLIKN